jgi:hypothetical protein
MDSGGGENDNCSSRVIHHLPNASSIIRTWFLTYTLHFYVMHIHPLYPQIQRYHSSLTHASCSSISCDLNPLFTCSHSSSTHGFSGTNDRSPFRPPCLFSSHCLTTAASYSLFRIFFTGRWWWWRVVTLVPYSTSRDSAPPWLRSSPCRGRYWGKLSYI